VPVPTPKPPTTPPQNMVPTPRPPQPPMPPQPAQTIQPQTPKPPQAPQSPQNNKPIVKDFL
jgi:hypothetical protein